MPRGLVTGRVRRADQLAGSAVRTKHLRAVHCHVPNRDREGAASAYRSSCGLLDDAGPVLGQAVEVIDELVGRPHTAQLLANREEEVAR